MIDLLKTGDPDQLMLAVTLVIPPVALLLVRSKVRAVIYSVVAIWILMNVGAQYHLAYTPGYDSLGPGFAIFFGWLPSTLYSLAWWVVFSFVRSLRKRNRDRNEVK